MWHLHWPLLGSAVEAGLPVHAPRRSCAKVANDKTSDLSADLDADVAQQMTRPLMSILTWMLTWILMLRSNPSEHSKSRHEEGMPRWGYGIEVGNEESCPLHFQLAGACD